MLKDPDFIKQFIEREGGAAEQADPSAAATEQPEETKEAAAGGAAVNMDQTQMVKRSIKETNVDFTKLKMDCKPFYPHDVLFEMMIPRELLKKHVGLKRIHKLVM
mmetsp:Transcript_1192/g.1827  ORF Transcript_1192/g.1827 Transcript_1192/m.1827 type:complete len:105 (+) Transcript_1192:428-742(+)